MQILAGTLFPLTMDWYKEAGFILKIKRMEQIKPLFLEKSLG